MLDAWISPWWQAACLPRKWDVAGVVVPSLSVWHTFALESVGNPYMCGGMLDYDAAAALLIFARQDWRGGLRLIHDAGFRASEMRRMHRALRRVPLREVTEACRDYVETCTRAPRRWQKSGGGGGRAAVPYQFHLVRVLCSDYGLDLARAWNTPYAQARSYYDSHAEANGDTSVMRPDHEALDDEMYEQQQAELQHAEAMNN